MDFVNNQKLLKPLIFVPALLLFGCAVLKASPPGYHLRIFAAPKIASAAHEAPFSPLAFAISNQEPNISQTRPGNQQPCSPACTDHSINSIIAPLHAMATSFNQQPLDDHNIDLFFINSHSIPVRTRSNHWIPLSNSLEKQIGHHLNQTGV